METIVGILGIAALISLPFLIAALVIWIKRKIQLLLIRKAEEKILKNKWANARNAENVTSTIYFTYATIFGITMISFSLPLSWRFSTFFVKTLKSMPTMDYWTATTISSLAQVPALLMVPIVLYLHYSGIGGRKLKYELLLSSALSAWFGSAYVTAVLRLGAVTWRPGTSVGLAVGLLFWWLVFCVAQAFVPRLLARYEEHRSLRRWFYRFQSRLWWALAWFLLPCFVLYCLVRFHIVRISERHPILYFRSFGLKDGSLSFGRIVAPAVRRFGIVEGLVTDAQRGSDLQASLTLTDQGHFMAAEDASWKNWVADRLSIASVAIIDMTGSSNNVSWEVCQSLSSLGTTRVAFLYSGARPSIPEGVWELNYGLSRGEIRRARRELSNWLKKNILTAERRDSMEISAGAGQPYAPADAGQRLRVAGVAGDSGVAE